MKGIRRLKQLKKQFLSAKELELIAIHIYKTGGKSFRIILKNQYGDKYYDINIKKNAPTEERRRKIASIPGDARVVHGHFQYNDIGHLADSTGAKINTWLRNPVEMVISQYYYLLKNGNFDRPARRNRKNKIASLDDYIRRKRNPNTMTKFLEGIDLKDIYFVGILEYFKEDVLLLSEKLNWKKKISISHVNKNENFKSQYPVASQEQRKLIAKYNAEDVDLYNRVLDLKRRKTVTF